MLVGRLASARLLTFGRLGARCGEGVLLRTLLAIVPRLLTGDVKCSGGGQRCINMILLSIQDQDAEKYDDGDDQDPK